MTRNSFGSVCESNIEEREITVKLMKVNVVPSVPRLPKQHA